MEAKYLEITLDMHFKCNIGGKGKNSGLKASDRTLVWGTKFFCLLCLWRQTALKSPWLCISNAILVEKGQTLGLKHPTELWYGELNFFVGYAYGGKIRWNHHGYAFQVQYWWKIEKLELKASDQTLVRGTKFFCGLCSWRQNTLKSSWLCISSAILVEKGKTCPTELFYG